MKDLAERVRDACLQAALHAYEDAGIQGLCAAGRWEAAVGAIETLDLAPVLDDFQHRSADETVPAQGSSEPGLTIR